MAIHTVLGKKPIGKMTDVTGHFRQAELTINEYSNWFRDQNDTYEGGYPSKASFVLTIEGIDNDYPETENVKIVRGALEANPMMKLVATCVYGVCRRRSYVDKAKWLKEQGVNMGDKPSMMQANMKLLEHQLLAYVQGVIVCRNDDDLGLQD